MPVATTSTTANERIVVQQQDCVASAAEQVIEYSNTWVMLDRIVLKLDDRNILLMLKWQAHIRIIHAVAFERQFLSVLGLKSTLIAKRHGGVLPQNGLQALLVCYNHWILLFTMKFPQGSVTIYYSAFIVSQHVF